jgi:hypothetical protein
MERKNLRKLEAFFLRTGQKVGLFLLRVSAKLPPFSFPGRDKKIFKNVGGSEFRSIIVALEAF